MFCSKCGNRLQDNAKFCDKCGAPVSGEKKRKKGAVIGIACSAVVALAAVIACIVIVNNRNEADPALNSRITDAAEKNGHDNREDGENKSDKNNKYNTSDDYEEEGVIVYDFPTLEVHGDDYDWSAAEDAESHEWDDGTVFYPDDDLIVYENGDFYVGEWEDNQKSGYGVYYFDNGVIYEGDFFKGEISGIGKLLFNDNSTYEGVCSQGIPHGIGILLTADGKEYNGGWMYGRFIEGEGEWEIYGESRFPVIERILKSRLGENTGSGNDSGGKKETDLDISTTVNTEAVKPAAETAKPVSKDPVLVAEALSEDPTAYKITPDSVYIQDLVDFCDGQLSYDQMSSKDYHRRTFKGSKEDFRIIEAYVNAICDGNYNLTLVKSHYEEIKTTFFSFGIDYTGTAKIKQTTNVTYTETDSNMVIYGEIDKGKLKAVVCIPSSMEIVDLGLRFGQSAQNAGTNAPSATTGLYRLSDGSFKTEDGRLTAALGEAAVLRDGKLYSSKANFNKNSRDSRDELWVRGFYSDETIVFFSPLNSIKTGSIFTYKNLMREQSYVNESPTLKEGESQFTNYSWTLCFGLCHNGDWITPLSGKYNRFEDLYVRVMYYEPGSVIVYYIYAELDSKPNVVEALCAVDLKNLSESVDADGEYSMYVGESISIDGGREFDSTYNTYKWEIVSGSDLVTLTGDASRSCTVSAEKEGSVRVRLTYEYGIKEPDVLTGIMRTANKSRTLEYVITIKKK